MAGNHLEETVDEEPLIARSQKGDASELVVDKEDLAAFCDPRWLDVPYDEAELAEALREPAPLFEIHGLEEVPWHKYTHAYGTASEVPKDIRGLVSSQGDVRNRSLWELFGSIYHQGTIYPATSIAVPFLIRIAADQRLLDRPKVCELLNAIAESCANDPERVSQNWSWRREHFGETYAKSTEEMASDELAVRGSVRLAFLDYAETIQSLVSDTDTEVSKWAASILDHLGATGKGL
jgi:hypothetical protein